VQQAQPAMVADEHAEPQPRRSIRARHAPEKYMLLMTTGPRDILLLDNEEPNTYTKVVMGPESEKWLEAMRSEMDSMKDNRVWNESPIVVRKDLGNLIEIGNFGCDLKTKTFHYGGRRSYHEGRFVLNERSEWTGEIIGFTGP
jgi:hypothetical protein